MTIGVLKEPPYEKRVSLIDDAVKSLTRKGITVIIEKGAGEKAFCSNSDYENAGGKIASAHEVVAQSDIILSINAPAEDLHIPPSKILIGVYHPLYHHKIIRQWAGHNLTIFSLDLLPRNTRAQSMDVLSSQANIAGYKAVLLASNIYSRYFPMFMTAAGSVKPAQVIILGAGVAGLQAIATAKRLGAVVEVFDTRPTVKEEVISLGAKFIEVEGSADASKAGGYAVEQTKEYQQKQKQKIAECIKKADIVITTAQIPGKKAPQLITEEMLATMRKGSVIIDLAAATGGNTPVTKNDQTIHYDGITIVGNSNLPATMPADASRMYGKNVLNFLQLLIDKDGKLEMNWKDELVKGSCVTHDGEIIHERVKSLLLEKADGFSEV